MVNNKAPKISDDSLADEKKIPSEHGPAFVEPDLSHAFESEKEVLESGEQREDEDVDHQKLKDQIDAMDSGVVAGKASTNSPVNQDALREEKVKKLVLVAQEKGVMYAVTMAKKMGDPYIMDMLHDSLAAQGLYKKFKN